MMYIYTSCNAGLKGSSRPKLLVQLLWDWPLEIKVRDGLSISPIIEDSYKIGTSAEHIFRKWGCELKELPLSDKWPTTIKWSKA